MQSFETVLRKKEQIDGTILYMEATSGQSANYPDPLLTFSIALSIVIISQKKLAILNKTIRLY